MFKKTKFIKIFKPNINNAKFMNKQRFLDFFLVRNFWSLRHKEVPSGKSICVSVLSWTNHRLC